MQASRQDGAWARACEFRKYQHLFGCISGILFAIALLALLDGLIAQMRRGANELELLPGQVLTISGPAVLKNPLASDVMARFTPAGAPFIFDLEGFFAGYWFGNGMWRGTLTAMPDAEAGNYGLVITFKGASARTAQQYELRIYGSSAAMREASFSFLKRWLDINPFILAAWCGSVGIISGVITYFCGIRYGKHILELGLAETYSYGDSSIFCLVAREFAPAPGSAVRILDGKGYTLGVAHVERWKKGKLWLSFSGEFVLPPGALISLQPQAEAGSSGQEMPSGRIGQNCARLNPANIQSSDQSRKESENKKTGFNP